MCLLKFFSWHGGIGGNGEQDRSLDGRQMRPIARISQLFDITMKDNGCVEHVAGFRVVMQSAFRAG